MLRGRRRARGSAWAWLALALVVAGVASTEASLGVEQKRRQSDDHPHLDLSSVWTFAGAVLLVGPLAVVVAMAIYLHIYLRVWRRNGVPVHRVLFSTATILLAVQAAAAVTDRIGNDELFRSVPGVLAVVAAMVVYMLVNLALVVLVIVISGPSRRFATVRQAIGPFDDVALEFATLAMGALVAAAASTFGPPYILLGLPPLIVLHRTRLVRQLEEDASTDGKTGLLTAAAWQEKAGRAVLRSERGDQARQRARARPRPLQARQRPFRAPRRRPGAGRRRRVAARRGARRGPRRPVRRRGVRRAAEGGRRRRPAVGRARRRGADPGADRRAARRRRGAAGDG